MYDIHNHEWGTVPLGVIECLFMFDFAAAVLPFAIAVLPFAVAVLPFATAVLPFAVADYANLIT